MTVLLEMRCERRWHLVGHVLDTDEGLVFDATRYALGRTKSTWTPARFTLTRGSGHRYGCSCGFSHLIRDEALARAIDQGYRVWILPRGGSAKVSGSPSGSAK